MASKLYTVKKGSKPTDEEKKKKKIPVSKKVVRAATGKTFSSKEEMMDKIAEDKKPIPVSRKAVLKSTGKTYANKEALRADLAKKDADKKGRVTGHETSAFPGRVFPTKEAMLKAIRLKNQK